jgi:hypothetical protein
MGTADTPRPVMDTANPPITGIATSPSIMDHLTRPAVRTARCNADPAVRADSRRPLCVKRGVGLSGRPRPLAAVFRPEFGPAFVRPDCLARFAVFCIWGLRSEMGRRISSGQPPHSRFRPAPAQPAVLLARSAIPSSRSARSNNFSRAFLIGVCRANSLIFSAIAT